jgi:hypothetical protein
MLAIAAVTAAVLLCSATARAAPRSVRAPEPGVTRFDRQSDGLNLGFRFGAPPSFTAQVAGTLQDLVEFHRVPNPGFERGDFAITGAAPLLPEAASAAPLAAGSLYDLFVTEARSGRGAGFKFRVSEVEAEVAAKAASVPQPATWALMLTCAAIIGGIFRRRRAAALKRFAIGWR